LQLDVVRVGSVHVRLAQDLLVHFLRAGSMAMGGGTDIRAWLNQFWRLRVRYEKRADIHEAFLALGCILICWRFLDEQENS
jgi:hypothetical protein